jgi:hypothetical protein
MFGARRTSEGLSLATLTSTGDLLRPSQMSLHAATTNAQWCRTQPLSLDA